MTIMAKDTGNSGDFTPVPQGTHLAICNTVVDLGLQEIIYMSVQSVKHQVYVRWELLNERIDWKDAEGKEREGPMSIGKTYTLSLHEKANLRKDLEGWRGKAFSTDELQGFDITKLLGVPCQVTVTHREKDLKTYANVTGVAGWPKGMDKPREPENPVLIYSDDDTASLEKLPQWLRDKIAAQIRPENFEGGPAYQEGDPGAASENDYGTKPDGLPHDPGPASDFDDSVPF